MKGLSKLKKGIFVVVAMLMIILSAVTANAQHQNPPSEPAGDSTHIQQELLKCEPVEKYDDEIQAEDITPAVASEILESYPGHEVSNAYQAPDGSYKVKINKGDEKVTAYYSINGELLREENLEDGEEK